MSRARAAGPARARGAGRPPRAAQRADDGGCRPLDRARPRARRRAAVALRRAGRRRPRRAAARARDDPQGGRCRPRARRRQGRDLRAPPTTPGSNGGPGSTGARSCTTSATSSTRSRAVTSPRRTSASAPRTSRRSPSAPLTPSACRRPHGGAGDPSPSTARGVLAAMRACAARRVRLGRPGRASRSSSSAPVTAASSSPGCSPARAPSSRSPTSIPAKRMLAAELGAELDRPGGGDARALRRARAVRARRRDRRRERRRAALRGSSAARRTTSSPTSRWPSELAGARDPLRARLRRQRRRADQRLPRAPRARGGRGRCTRRGDRGRDRARPRRSPTSAAITPLGGRPRARPASASEAAGTRRSPRERLRLRGTDRLHPARHVPYEEARADPEAARGRAAGGRDRRTSCSCSSTRPSTPRAAARPPDELPMGEDWYRMQGIEVDRDRPRRPGHLPRHRPARRLPDRQPAALRRRRPRLRPQPRAGDDRLARRARRRGAACARD